AKANDLSGAGGNDVLAGGTGNDLLSGGTGSDTLSGGAGNDVLSGGDGGDLLSGGAHEDTLLGGAGDDILDGGDGGDAMSGGGGNDLLSGGAGGDTLSGGAGDDTIDGADGADVLSGGTGFDVLSYASAGSGVAVDGSNGTASGGDTFVGFEAVVGSAYADEIGGGEDNDLLSGGAGHDTLSGNAGNDTLVGGAGDDVLAGQGGNDLLSGGSGNDLLNHNVGDDTFYGGDGTDTVQSGWSIDSQTSHSATQDRIIVEFAGGAGGSVQIENDVETIVLDGVTYSYSALQDALNAYDPLVLDLDGDGIELSGKTTSTTRFDINGDGLLDQVAWAYNGDGVLAHDRDGNGKISGRHELFSEAYAPGLASTGYAALALLDSNADGHIDDFDDAFGEIVVWVDANADGVSDDGEVSGLAAHDIASISLQYESVDDEIAGNPVLSIGVAERTDGTSVDMAEAKFRYVDGLDLADEESDLDAGAGDEPDETVAGAEVEAVPQSLAVDSAHEAVSSDAVDDDSATETEVVEPAGDEDTATVAVAAAEDAADEVPAGSSAEATASDEALDVEPGADGPVDGDLGVAAMAGQLADAMSNFDASSEMPSDDPAMDPSSDAAAEAVDEDLNVAA
ncbi:calcium-binding protein, partial [Thalassobaculum sp.]|uniref:calcium-binding protein n=1 Tax=Thalassobaculum sp. TaxID=2022740 RepID=UPI0032EB03C6